ncbi:MAG TPA: hypothetical protein VGL62_16155, partial [Vicinamibacterales bacterium]
TIGTQDAVSRGAQIDSLFTGDLLAIATASAGLNGSLGALVESDGNATASATADAWFHITAGDPEGTCGSFICSGFSGATLDLTIDGGPIAGAAGAEAYASAVLFGPGSSAVGLGLPPGTNGEINLPLFAATSQEYWLPIGTYDIDVHLNLGTLGPGSADFSHTLDYSVDVPAGVGFSEASGLLPVTDEGAPPSVSPVPEPATLLLLAPALPIAIRRARRARV